MPEPRKDELTPTDKDPAEGARSGNEGAPPVAAPDQSHLGAAGDPAEGAEDKAGG